VVVVCGGTYGVVPRVVVVVVLEPVVLVELELDELELAASVVLVPKV
jgi:hypothetical protein